MHHMWILWRHLRQPWFICSKPNQVLAQKSEGLCKTNQLKDGPEVLFFPSIWTFHPFSSVSCGLKASIDGTNETVERLALTFKAVAKRCVGKNTHTHRSRITHRGSEAHAHITHLASHITRAQYTHTCITRHASQITHTLHHTEHVIFSDCTHHANHAHYTYHTSHTWHTQTSHTWHTHTDITHTHTYIAYTTRT